MERTFNDFIEELKQLAARGERNQERIQGALTLLESIEWTKQRHPKPEPPPPGPTKDAPDPGPGWRLLKQGEVIHSNDQNYCRIDKAWFPANRLGEEVRDGTYRTPIYHNPANLETAGEGYRFLLKGEKRPADIEFWLEDEWVPGGPDPKEPLSYNHTYRTNKPLPTT